MHGRLRIPAPGTPSKRTKQGAYNPPWKSFLQKADDAGECRGSLAGSLSLLTSHSFLTSAAPIRRTIIRHLILVLDLSASMTDRDMRPTRFDLTLQYAREFIAEWFDQNPLGQIGIVGMRAGLGERIGEMSGITELPVDFLGTPPDFFRQETHKRS